MNCYYHPDRIARAQCSGCGKNLCEQCTSSLKDGAPICTRCQALEAATDAAKGIDDRIAKKQRQTEQKTARTRRRQKIARLVQLVVIVIAFLIIAFQFPKILVLFKEEKPLRHGHFKTDGQTDQCIRDLWKISGLLQEGRLPDSNMLCPASKKPYEVIKTDSDVIVRSPSPELYGFREIRVSKRKPVPELVK